MEEDQDDLPVMLLQAPSEPPEPRPVVIRISERSTSTSETIEEVPFTNSMGQMMATTWLSLQDAVSIGGKEQLQHRLQQQQQQNESSHIGSEETKEDQWVPFHYSPNRASKTFGSFAAAAGEPTFIRNSAEDVIFPTTAMMGAPLTEDSATATAAPWTSPPPDAAVREARDNWRKTLEQKSPGGTQRLARRYPSLIETHGEDEESTVTDDCSLETGSITDHTEDLGTEYSGSTFHHKLSEAATRRRFFESGELPESTPLLVGVLQDMRVGAQCLMYGGATCFTIAAATARDCREGPEHMRKRRRGKQRARSPTVRIPE